MVPRTNPFDLVFADLAADRFPAIAESLRAAGHDPVDRDAWLMQRGVVELLHELRPEEGLGEGMDQLVAFAHHAFLFWTGGRRVREVAADQLPGLLGGDEPGEGPIPAPFYAQLPEHRVWAEVVVGESHEPLDGCFVHGAAGTLRVLGAFGLHPQRAGLTVVEAVGPAPGPLARADGSALFAPALPGGAAAGLYSIVGAEELLSLGWRTTRLMEVATA